MFRNRSTKVRKAGENIATLIDYINANSHRDFRHFHLNELDIAAINEIGYLSFDDLVDEAVDASSVFKLSQIHVNDKDKAKESVYNFLITKERVALFHAIRDSKRFKNLSLSHYVNEVDPEFEKQFAAMVFTIPEINHIQMVFRGTDDSLIGWKEDFKLTYMKEVAANRSALSYLSGYLINHPNTQLVLSGHSKGGHLALYAAAFLASDLQEQLLDIYLLDSPGLAEEFLQREGYRAIRKRLRVIRPQESVVGVMLYCDVKARIVKSASFGLLQHKTCNWQVSLDGRFEEASQASRLSKTLELVFKDWTKQLSKRDLKLVCDSLFDALISSGITSLNAFTLNDKAFVTFFQIISSLHSLDQSKKSIIMKSVQQLIVDYTGYRKREVTEKIQTRLSKYLKKSKSNTRAVVTSKSGKE